MKPVLCVWLVATLDGSADVSEPGALSSADRTPSRWWWSEVNELFVADEQRLKTPRHRPGWGANGNGT